MNIKFQHDYSRRVDTTTSEAIAEYLFNNRFDNPQVWDYQTDETVNRLFYQEGSWLVSFQFICWQIYEFVDWLMEIGVLRPRERNDEELKNFFFERVDFLYTNYITHGWFTKTS